MSKSFFPLLSLFLLASCAEQPAPVLSLADYLDVYSMDGDATLAFHRALDDCRAKGASALVIPEGTYEVYPEYAYERYQYVSNNDASLKHILLDLEGMKHFELRGEQAHILLHGFMSPISVTHCEDITIGGLSIDYARTFHNEGTVVGVGENTIDLHFSEAYPHYFSEGHLYFCDTLGNEYPSHHMLEFDAVRHEPAWRALDYWLDSSMPAEDLGDDVYRLTCKNVKATVGNTMVMGAAKRYCPGIVLDHSAGVRLHDINIYHCGGMGVIGQFSKDIELDHIRVVPSPGTDRMVSITADATHFVLCDGYLRILNCEFFNQIDDATNIHGIYCTIARVLPSGQLLVEFSNDAQHNLDVLEAGAEAEIVQQGSLIIRTECRVTAVDKLNSTQSIVTVEGDLSAVSAGNLIARKQYPEVLIKGCRLGNNRARGFLLGSRAGMVIEDCWFHTSGASLLFEGDGNFWYEQAGPRNVIIRNNTFDRCMYGAWTWGWAPIASNAGPRSDRRESAYNRNILIEGNHFILNDPRIIDVYSVDSLVMRDNTIESVLDYPYEPENANREPCKTKDCSRIHIDLDAMLRTSPTGEKAYHLKSDVL